MPPAAGRGRDALSVAERDAAATSSHHLASNSYNYTSSATQIPTNRPLIADRNHVRVILKLKF